MIHLGLVGFPLGHSLSPRIHAAALRACGLEGSYSLFPVPADDDLGLKSVLDRVRSGELMGLNVTIPHKQTVIGWMDQLTPTARSIGAVNTIHVRGNKLIGDNTDAAGFLSDLNRFLGKRISEPGSSALVLGAGGSARAVVHALAQDGWQVSIFARRIEQARQLASLIPDGELQLPADISDIDLSQISLVVNATPLGMAPHTDRTPWPEGLPFPAAAIYDLVYNPPETRLVKEALEQGLPATTGLGMLIEQAGLAFEIWTGRNPPREILFDSVKQTDPP